MKKFWLFAVLALSLTGCRSSSTGGGTAGGGSSPAGGAGTPAGEEPAASAAAYTTNDIYEDILFFESRVNAAERALFLENFQAIGDAILDACPIYFPEFPLLNCARIFVSNVLKESTFYQFEANETDTEFPTLGLLQIRRSSTVEDFNAYGNTSVLQTRGAYFADPTDDEMMNILYNIHLGMWYISLHGRSNALYAWQYCTRRELVEADPGTLIVGLSSHRIGPTAYREGDAGDLATAQNYVDEIRTDYLRLFEAEGRTPDADYFNQTLPYLASLCR